MSTHQAEHPLPEETKMTDGATAWADDLHLLAEVAETHGALAALLAIPFDPEEGWLLGDHSLTSLAVACLDMVRDGLGYTPEMRVAVFERACPACADGDVTCGRVAVLERRAPGATEGREVARFTVHVDGWFYRGGDDGDPLADAAWVHASTIATPIPLERAKAVAGMRLWRLCPHGVAR